jgi:hypothetical protein
MLARHLDSLPLELATARTYLRQTPDSFGDYLHVLCMKTHDVLGDRPASSFDIHGCGPLGSQSL